MLSPKADAAHEAKCERCGVGCHAAVPLADGRMVVVEDLHCKFYGTAPDGKPGCTVYEDRFEKAPWCLHIPTARYMGALRVGCPYSTSDSPGKTRVGPEEYDRLWPQLVAAILENPVVNLSFSWKKFLQAASKREPDQVWGLSTNVTETTGRITRKKTAWARFKDSLPGDSQLHK